MRKLLLKSKNTMQSLLEARQIDSAERERSWIKPVNNITDILTTFIRHSSPLRNFDLRNSYGSYLDSILASFQSIKEPPHIPGRVYGGSRPIGVSLILDEYKALLLACPPNESWNFNENVMQPLLSDICDFNGRRSLIYDLEKLLDISEENMKIANRIRPIVSCEDRGRDYTNFIKNIIQRLGEKNHENILAEPLDDEYLCELGRNISRIAFNSDRRNNFLSLFKEQGICDESTDTEECNWRLSGMKRYLLTKKYRQSRYRRIY